MLSDGTLEASDYWIPERFEDERTRIAIWAVCLYSGWNHRHEWKAYRFYVIFQPAATINHRDEWTIYVWDVKKRDHYYAVFTVEKRIKHKGQYRVRGNEKWLNWRTINYKERKRETSENI